MGQNERAKCTILGIPIVRQGQSHIDTQHAHQFWDRASFWDRLSWKSESEKPNGYTDLRRSEKIIGGGYTLPPRGGR